MRSRWSGVGSLSGPSSRDSIGTVWTATSDASGLYYYKLKASPIEGGRVIFSRVNKMMVVK